MSRIGFYIYDFETGYYLTDKECGEINEFSSLNYAEKLCKKLSKMFNKKFGVSVAIETILFENGKKVEF